MTKVASIRACMIFRNVTSTKTSKIVIVTMILGRVSLAHWTICLDQAVRDDQTSDRLVKIDWADWIGRIGLAEQRENCPNSMYRSLPPDQMGHM